MQYSAGLFNSILGCSRNALIPSNHNNNTALSGILLHCTKRIRDCVHGRRNFKRGGAYPKSIARRRPQSTMAVKRAQKDTIKAVPHLVAS